MRTRGWDVAFKCQPPNSPDLNTEDLAFFRGIQSLQFQKNAYTIDELMVNVLEAFDEFPLETCKKVWTTAQMVMNEILLCHGDNSYKLPHAGKDKIVRKMKRDIPLRLPCQAMITNSSLNGDAIVRYVESLSPPLPPPPNNSFVPPLPPPPNNSFVESSIAPALLLLAGAASGNALMEEEEGAVGTADDNVVLEQEDCAKDDEEAYDTPSEKEFWENFESKIAWGGEEYDNHEEGLVQPAIPEDKTEQHKNSKEGLVEHAVPEEETEHRTQSADAICTMNVNGENIELWNFEHEEPGST